MATAEKTVGVLQAEIESAIQRLGTASIPAGLEGLVHLIPPKGTGVRVSLRHAESNRQIRRNADASSYRPQESVIVLSYEAEDSEDSGAAESPFDGDKLSNSERVRDLIVALDAAERDPRFRDFVALKSFRDSYLTARSYSWAIDEQERQLRLAEAISSGLVVTSKVPNPRAPAFPVTAIRLNRSNVRVAEILRAATAERSPFSPVAHRGSPLSHTIIAERR